MTAPQRAPLWALIKGADARLLAGKMLHTAHEKLILALEAKVKEGPPASGHAAPYFQAAWALIKKIGPSFKETHYPKRPLRDSAWTRFQAATDAVKAQQKPWELRSAKLQAELLARLEKAMPEGFSMAALMDPPPEEKEKEATTADAPAPTEPGDDAAPPAPLTERQRKRAELEEKTASALAVLDDFNAGKDQLTHAHFKIVSTRLREVRQQIDAAWERFKGEKVARADKRKRGRADGHSPWRQKQEWYRNKLTDALANDEALLANKQGALASFRQLLAKAEKESDRKRLQTWITDAEQICAELEANIAKLRPKLASAASQLAADKKLAAEEKA